MGEPAMLGRFQAIAYPPSRSLTTLPPCCTKNQNPSRRGSIHDVAD